jgi:regulator of protease activity HflC (stomatin/prohibitin superfamily)
MATPHPAILPADSGDETPPPERRFWRKHLLWMVTLTLVVAFFFVYLIPDEFIFIYPGSAGVLWHRFFYGEVTNKVYGEGTHIILPWDKMYVYSLLVQSHTEDVHLLTIDGLEVTVKINVRTELDERNLPAINERLGTDYMKMVVVPQLEAATRSILARYEAEQLHVNDEETLSADIQKVLTAAPDMELIGVRAVNIMAITLPPGLQRAIESKNEERQKSLQFDYQLQLARKEAERKQIEASGIKNFQQTVGASLNQNYLLYQAIQATQALAASPNAKTVVIGSGKDGLPIILGNALAEPTPGAVGH